jgi:hypothetical protein
MLKLLRVSCYYLFELLILVDKIGLESREKKEITGKKNS